MPENKLDNKQNASVRRKIPESSNVSAANNWDRHEPWWLRHRGASARRVHIANARGIRISRLKAAALYRGIAILTLNAMIFAAGLEFLARSGLKLQELVSSPASELVGEGNPRETVSYYMSQNWARRYWHEFRLSRKQRYYPYVGWRRAPFKGETINVDQNGIRATPGADCREGSFKVFAFGESSMWGTGSPDWGTIPAYLQRELETIRRGPICVVNFAESAYVSTQDVIMLLMQLQSEKIPDWVLFYNTGDIYAAYQSGRSGVVQNVDQIAAKFETGANEATLLARLRNTASYSLFERLIDRSTIANPEQKKTAPKQLITYRTMGIDAKKLSGSVVQNYFENYRIVNALGEKYGFKALFFLPPHLSLGNKQLTVEEVEMKREEESDPVLSTLASEVYHGLERQSVKHQNVHSLANIFNDRDDLMWIDAGHATPVGNEVIARKILNLIQPQSWK